MLLDRPHKPKLHMRNTTVILLFSTNYNYAFFHYDHQINNSLAVFIKEYGSIVLKNLSHKPILANTKVNVLHPFGPSRFRYLLSETVADNAV